MKYTGFSFFKGIKTGLHKRYIAVLMIIVMMAAVGGSVSTPVGYKPLNQIQRLI